MSVHQTFRGELPQSGTKLPVAERSLNFASIAAAAEKLAERTLWPERARALRHIAADSLHAAETGDTASIDSVTDFISEDADLEAAVSYRTTSFGMGAGL